MHASGSRDAAGSRRARSTTGRIGRVLAGVLLFTLTWLGMALLIAAAIIHYHWGKVTVVQVLMNLMSMEIGGGGGVIVWVCILGIGVVPLLLTIAIMFWPSIMRRLRHRSSKTRTHQSASDHTRPTWFGRGMYAVVVLTLIIGGPAAFVSTVQVTDYIDAADSSYEIGDHYVKPNVTSEGDERNMVMVYLESGEAALGDDEVFEKDAYASLKEVTRAEDGWQSIDDLREYDGSGWTMAGLVSTQCGVPLDGILSAASSGSYAESGVGTETYLGGLTCFGDILKDNGYTNVFLGGANPSFAAKDTMLGDHGYSKVLGRGDWRDRGEPDSSFRSDWGLSDQRLMEYAKDELDALHAESEVTGEPFNLSVLTLDTHEPVHVHDYCTVDTEKEATSVYACSMDQVAGLVKHMEEQGYLEDTAVVIMGDHLKPVDAGDAFHEELGDDETRALFNRIWVPGGEEAPLRSDMDQLNMFPTLLEIAGLNVEDHEAGLGVSAFTTEVPEDSAQSLPDEAYTELLKSRSSQFYEDAWVGEDVTP
ncbi:sulfatase-like hydrolase/transferase [Nesterenkonia sp. Act20]|uniref:sulfatase-like hydrolase/transferase n=1 Tax=Nesterenkonia sp. Act20 TaxID=1483432 RepID=UPI001C43E884|nr:sulfatase-like hydrolase/transferase [Nesterenkonia sp. Act20]